MKDLKTACRLALVQCAPVMFDKKKGTDKVVGLIAEAAREKAELIVFPELVIPGYPYGMSFGFKTGCRDENGRRDWKLYYDNSILVPGEETARIAEAAAAARAYVSIGVSERDAVTATLYNTNLVFGPYGALLTVHRKLKPTGSERLVWGEADRGFAPVTDTPWGPAGSLICWESYMPLLRAALYQKGMTICLAPNTNDYDSWLATARHIAVEGRCFYVNADLCFTRDMYPGGLAYPEEIDALPEIVCRGGSCVIDPYGNYEIEPFWDQEGIRYADLDMNKVPASRMEFDPCGHYSRPDVLKLNLRDE